MDEILLYGAHGIIVSSPPLLQLRVCAAYASVLTHRTLRTLNLAKPQRMRFCCSHLQRRHGIMDDVMVLTSLYRGVSTYIFAPLDFYDSKLFGYLKTVFAQYHLLHIPRYIAPQPDTAARSDSLTRKGGRSVQPDR